MYYIDIIRAEHVLKKLNKHPLKDKIVADIDSLAYTPFKGKYLASHDIYELRYPNLRIYYAVQDGLIVVAESERPTNVRNIF